MQFGKAIRNQWHLDPGIVFLNNGSFGATPIKVLEAVRNYDVELEREPVRFYLDIYPGLLERSRQKLSEFLKVDKGNLVLTDNATTAVNTILRYMQSKLQKGDALLFTNHVYPAVRNTLNHIAELTGAELIEVKIGYPCSKEEILESVEKAINDKVKLALFDHISSATAVIFPVKELTEICHRNGTNVLIDGAHAPGMIEPDIEGINAEWYVANCHKWLFAPKSCAFIVTKKEKQEEFHPLVISLDYGTNYQKEFSWVGTRNFSSMLALYDAIKFYENLGAEEIRNYNHSLVIEAGKLISGHIETIYNKDESMTGSMLTMKLPELKGNYKILLNTELRDLFIREYMIEIPFMMFDNRIWFRISAQVYNEIEDYRIFAAAITRIVG